MTDSAKRAQTEPTTDQLPSGETGGESAVELQKYNRTLLRTSFCAGHIYKSCAEVKSHVFTPHNLHESKMRAPCPAKDLA